jgi:hypothetical protein
MEGKYYNEPMPDSFFFPVIVKSHPEYATYHKSLRQKVPFKTGWMKIIHVHLLGLLETLSSNKKLIQ